MKDNRLDEDKITNKKWFIITILLLVPPMGLYFMWKNKIFSKLTRIIITIIVALFLVVITQYDPDEVRINKAYEAAKTNNADKIKAPTE